MTATARAALLDPGAREWKEALERTGHDIYHLSDYVSLDATLCGGGNAEESGSSTVYATNAAWANLYASAHSWSLSGTVSGGRTARDSARRRVYDPIPLIALSRSS